MNIAVGTPLTPEQAQAMALQEAEQGVGFVSPNPSVGCVIVDKNHNFLSAGHTQPPGGNHAEIEALKNVFRDALQGATMYVTLEPCFHHGKTPPCVDRLLQEPLAQVIVGLQDPNPLVAGRGLQKLRDKGITVKVDAAFGEKVSKVTEVFLWHITQKIPFVALKVATSLDGQMALKSKDSRWITSEAARFRARELRAKYDATLIGARTLMDDDPLLDFRDTRWAGRKENKIVIWDPKDQADEFLPKSQLIKVHNRDNILVLKTPEIGRQELEQIYSAGITSLFVEGGAYTLQQFLGFRSFQKLYCFVAPCLLGQGWAWTRHLSVEKMQDRISFTFDSAEKIAEDILLTGYPR